MSSDGLDVVLARLRAAGLESIALIKALRDATDLDLPDAVAAIEALKDGRSLAHLTADRLPLLARARRAGGRWWPNLYCDAQFADAPWLTMTRGRDAPDLGSVYYWPLPEPPATAALWLSECTGAMTPEQRERFRERLAHDDELARTHPGSISGPGVAFDDFRADLRRLAASAAFWRDHVEFVRDADDALTCRFRLTPA